MWPPNGRRDTASCMSKARRTSATAWSRRSRRHATGDPMDTSGNWRAGANYDSLTRVVGGFGGCEGSGVSGTSKIG